MATNASVICRFSDGSYTYLRNDLTNATGALTEVKTDASGILNIAPNLSVGASNQDKLLVAAAVKIATDDSADGCFAYGAVYGTSGEVIVPLQGGGQHAAGLMPLPFPVKMTTGVTIKVAAGARGTGAGLIANVAVVTASGKCDIFTATQSDASSVAFLNKDSNSLGAALAGEQAVMVYCTYPSSYGIAEIGVADGINAVFVEDAKGNLKSLIYSTIAGGNATDVMTQYQMQSFSIDQNDTMTLRANT